MLICSLLPQRSHSCRARYDQVASQPEVYTSTARSSAARSHGSEFPSTATFLSGHVGFGWIQYHNLGLWSNRYRQDLHDGGMSGTGWAWHHPAVHGGLPRLQCFLRFLCTQSFRDEARPRTSSSTSKRLRTATHPSRLLAWILPSRGKRCEIDGKSTTEVRASYLQIYNEVISDLLKPDRSHLMIRRSPAMCDSTMPGSVEQQHHDC